MRLMNSFFRAYPLRTALMLAALLLSALAEGVGLSVLLPLLNIALGTDSGVSLPGNETAANDFELMVRNTLGSLGKDGGRSAKGGVAAQVLHEEPMQVFRG